MSSPAPQFAFTPGVLAASLSAAQVCAMRVLSPDTWISSLRRPLNLHSCRVLRGLRLVQDRTFETKWRLTPLGVQVRDALEP